MKQSAVDNIFDNNEFEGIWAANAKDLKSP
jgi:hypothetical protein